MDDIVQRDEAGDDTGAFTQNPWVRRVDDRNEPTLRSGCWRPVRLYAGPPGAPEGNKDYGVDRSDPLQNPQGIEQAAAPLLAVLVVAHSLGDELDVDHSRATGTEPGRRSPGPPRPKLAGPQALHSGVNSRQADPHLVDQRAPGGTEQMVPKPLRGQAHEPCVDQRDHGSTVHKIVLDL
jgi:hypothetical protein